MIADVLLCYGLGILGLVVVLDLTELLLGGGGWDVTYEVVRWLHDRGIHALCRSRRVVERERIAEWPAYVLPDGTLWRPDLDGVNGFSYSTIREMHSPRWGKAA